MNAVGYRESVAGNVPNPNTMPAYQRLFHADGSCDEVEIGTLTYHDIHHHYHLDGVMKYELLDSEFRPVKPNTKMAFCLADILKAAPGAAGLSDLAGVQRLRPEQTVDIREHGHFGRLGRRLRQDACRSEL
jgi:hypothetical protein